jgi:Transposase DDE domain/Domain of unknown function (DUF4372)
MKKKSQKQKPTKSTFTVLRQICNLIPNHLVPKLARETKVEEASRTYKPWSHLVALLYGQLAHSLGLNDLCDALGLHAGPLSAIRGATAPKRNTLSHANRQRDPAMAEKLFWQVLAHLQSLSPGFGGGRRPRFAFRFKRMIHVVDSTTIQLVARCLDWAKHRRRKAAAKCHLRLNLQSLLPSFAVVDTARHSDARKAWELCAGLLAGEIVIFDKAYLDLLHLFELFQRGVNWVTRAKEGMQFRVVRRYQRGRSGNILRDDLVQMKSWPSRRLYPAWLRRVIAMVEVDGKWREMTFLSDNLEWSAQTIVDLYRCRWAIEVFFKEIKQTLQLADFLGHNANAVRWQVWTALLTYVLLRFCAWISRWGHSFTRLFTLLRSALWLKLDLRGFLESYGTAGGSFRFLGRPEQAYLPGIC